MRGRPIAGIVLVVPTVQNSSGIWPKHARQWHRVGQPLRPTADDITHLGEGVRAWCARHGGDAPRVLLLGVTPELAGMAWPLGTELIALDRASDMIAAVWPGDTAWRRALCADWFRAPFASASFDLVVGDGALNMLPSIGAYPDAIAALAAHLSPEGRVLLRLFVRPQRAEHVADVFSALQKGAIDNFHILKWRLAMAVHGTNVDGVALADIWCAWQRAVPDPAALAARHGWTVETVQTIDAYRDQATRYTFPTLPELRALLDTAFFEEDCHVPDYAMGERCPRFVLRARRAPELP